MNEMILRVVKCGECFTVKSEKSDDGVLNKRTLVLQELGGKYANCYVVSALGNLATIQFDEGDIVIATLRFQSREYNGQMFMDVVATELIKKYKGKNARDKTKQDCPTAPEGALTDIPGADPCHPWHDGQRYPCKDLPRPERLHSLPEHLPK